MVSTIVLDLDGPLLDGMLRHYHCYRDILSGSGFVPVPMEQYWEMKRDRIDRLTLLAMSEAGLFHDDFLRLWRQRIEAWKYLESDRLWHGVSEILAEWKQSGLRLILATMRNNSRNLCRQLELLGIRDFMDELAIVGNPEGGTTKAAAVAPLLGDGDPGQAIWIGDTEVDISAARELGVRVCAVSCGLRNSTYLGTLSPDFLEPDLRSFAGKWGLNHAP